MPYKYFKRDDKYCVYKVDVDEKPIGDTLGCHDTTGEASKQIVAINMSEHSLKHFGVLGMKWGRRRGRSEESRSVSSLRKKSASELTNKELEAAIRRINLEKQYTALNPTFVSRGKAQVSSLLKSMGSKLVSTFIEKASAKIVETALGGK